MADKPLSSEELLGRRNAGRDSAANEIFDRYAYRLAALVRGRLGQRFQARFDPDDIVQSALRSFFRDDRSDPFVWRRAGDLWRILAAITLHKLQHQIERNSAAKRNVASEATAAEGDFTLIAAEPTPEHAFLLEDTLAIALARLTDWERSVVLARLAGGTIDEIAHDMRRSQRTVRRWLQQAESQLRSDLTDP